MKAASGHDERELAKKGKSHHITFHYQKVLSSDRQPSTPVSYMHIPHMRLSGYQCLSSMSNSMSGGVRKTEPLVPPSL